MAYGYYPPTPRSELPERRPKGIPEIITITLTRRQWLHILHAMFGVTEDPVLKEARDHIEQEMWKS